MLEVGLKYTLQQEVTANMSARAYGSGLVDVFATPAMIAFMEKTCLRCVLAELQEGEGTVGIHVNVSHSKATPVGAQVRCQAVLIQIDGKKLSFEVKAFDEEGEIGKGTHERFIINNEKFMAKLAKSDNSAPKKCHHSS